MSARTQLNRYFADRLAARATTHARRGRWVEADADLRRWDRLVPGDPDVAAMRARILFHQGRRQEALDAIDGSRLRGVWCDELAMLRSSLLEDDWLRQERDASHRSDVARRREWWAGVVEAIIDGASRSLRTGWSYLALAVLAALCLAIASTSGR
jgi:hypothetical protein